jgi:uncharacterized protein (TIGR02598 family)
VINLALSDQAKTLGNGSKAGFTLVEVVLALGIISFAIIGIIGMMPVAMRSALDSSQETDATLIAQRIFSEIKAGETAIRFVEGMPSNLNLSNSGTSEVIHFRDDGSVTNGVGDYAVRILVDTNTGMTNLSRVQVDIAAPAIAPESNRKTNSFVTLVGF